MSTETRTQTDKANCRRCPRCGDWIEFLPDQPLCAGCRRWSSRMRDGLVEAENEKKSEPHKEQHDPVKGEVRVSHR